MMRSFKGNLLSIDEVYQQFVNSNKFDEAVLPASSFHSRSQELILVQERGIKEAWHYENVANFYSKTVRSVLLGEASASLFSATERTVLQELLEAEILRNKAIDGEDVEQIGRIYLNKNLANDLASEVGEISEAQRMFIDRVADAAYVSNLPRAYSLSPVYAPSQAEYFDLVRDVSIGETEEETIQREEVCLTAEYIAGALARFQYDDIAAIRSSVAFKVFNELSEFASEPVRQRDEIELAFIELRRTIENRIIKKFGKPANAQKADITTIKKRWSLADDATSEMLSFSVSSALSALGVALAGPMGIAAGAFGTFTVSKLRKRVNQDEFRLNEISEAQREIQLRKIGEKVTFPEFPKLVKVTEKIAGNRNRNEVVVNPNQAPT
ncbi:hypothetical protein [Cohaesibacter marisflavi]|uniref:hypothetical protein n=1 Tax=Cohaesibacter marisflavi TaxID=655353 RepID=UPI0029C856B5|nr:hypothetical protein [Cohaesibacter marisflavi]